jgi:hypothetical protein
MKTRILPALLVAAVSACAAEEGVEGTEPVVSAEVVEVPSVQATIVAAPASAGFAAKLTPDERAAAGLEKLSAEQRTVLDAQIAKEVKLARDGDVRGFAGTFLSRRTDDERTAAGLGVLTAGEKYQLDRLVSRTLAASPPGAPVMITRPVTENDIFTTPFKWETHGFVQLEYGFGSSDREYKAATVGVTQVNPRTGTAFSFAYTIAEGDGLLWARGCEAGWSGRFR